MHQPGVAYGPVLHEGVRGRTREHVEDTLRRGGTLVVGGASPRIFYLTRVKLPPLF